MIVGIAVTKLMATHRYHQIIPSEQIQILGEDLAILVVKLNSGLLAVLSAKVRSPKTIGCQQNKR